MQYRFGSITVDADQHEVLVQGVRRHVEPKVFSLLLHLIENRDRVVTKDEVIDAVWDGRIVSDAAVSSAVSAARKAVGDTGSGQALIRTYHGLGFRFMAEPEKNPARLGGAAGAMASISVNTFAQPVPGSGIADLLGAAVVTELSRFRSFEVYRTPEARPASGDRISAPALRADFILAGTLWEAKDRLRVSAQLIDRAGGRHVWADSIDGETADVLTTVDRIAKRIAATVAGRIEASGHRRAVTGPPEALTANERVLRAQAFYSQVSPRAHSEALVLLEEVLADDPNHARALMLAGAIHDMAFFTGWSADPVDALARAIDLGRRAVAADPTDALAHAHLGEALLHAGRVAEAASHLEQALRLNPNDVAARTLYAAYLTERGEPVRALAELAAIRDLDPFELNWVPWIRAEAHFALGDHAAAISALEEIHQPINNARALLAACYALAGRQADAEATLHEFLAVAHRQMADPPTSFEGWRAFFMRESSQQATDLNGRFMAGLKAAGL